MAYAFQSSELVNTFEGRKDRLNRSAHLARCRVVMDRPHQVECHQVPAGEHEIDILQSRVEVVRKNMVWDEHEADRVRQAEALFQTDADRAFAEHRSGRGAGGPGRVADIRRKAEALAEWEQLPSKTRAKTEQPPALTGAELDVLDRRDQFVNEVLGSVSFESSFNRLFHRGVKPIRELEVLEAGLPLPEERERLEHEARAAERMAHAMRDHSGSSSGADMPDIDKLVNDAVKDALEKKLREMGLSDDDPSKH